MYVLYFLNDLPPTVLRKCHWFFCSWRHNHQLWETLNASLNGAFERISKFRAYKKLTIILVAKHWCAETDLICQKPRNAQISGGWEIKCMIYCKLSSVQFGRNYENLMGWPAFAFWFKTRDGVVQFPGTFTRDKSWNRKTYSEHFSQLHWPVFIKIILYCWLG